MLSDSEQQHSTVRGLANAVCLINRRKWILFLLHNLHNVLIQELNSMQERGIRSTWSRIRAKGMVKQRQKLAAARYEQRRAFLLHSLFRRLDLGMLWFLCVILALLVEPWKRVCLNTGGQCKACPYIHKKPNSNKVFLQKHKK